jgi:ribose-phosphate pyrophosphokinase
MTPIVFAMPGNETMADHICRARHWERGAWSGRRFPDGESYIRYLSGVEGRDIAIVCSLDDPDAKAIALYLAASVARELGARRIGLVTPYLAYMRQDKQFQAGEGITCRHFARLLSGVCDWLVTVDPHLHRVQSLDEIYGVETSIVPSAPGLARWIAARVDQPLLVGPDEESEQWVAQVASAIGCPYVLLRKTRSGDRDVLVAGPGYAGWQERTPVLVDDIASTARTMIAAAAGLRDAGMAPPWCVAVHAIFAGEAYADLLAAGVAGVASTNSISHRSNAIDLSASIGAAMALHFRNGPGC